MTEEEQEASLADAWTLQVASLGPSGWPHLVAMWFVVIEGVITFTTFAKSQKIVNLKRDAKITCMAESGSEYAELRGLVVEGDAEVTDDDEELSFAVMREMNKKYRGSPMAQTSGEQLRKTAAKRAVVRVRPTRVISWDHTKLGGRY